MLSLSERLNMPCIGAFTAARDLPGYISINQVNDEDVVITIREDGHRMNGDVHYGRTINLRLSLKDYEMLLNDQIARRPV